MPMTAKQMIKYIKKNGFQEVPSGGGSHRKFWNPDTKKTTVVPYHCKDLKKRHGASDIEAGGAKKIALACAVILISYIKGGL